MPTQLSTPHADRDPDQLSVTGRLGLIGRASECAALDRFLGAVAAGQGQALVMRGEPGVGKSSLLDHLTTQASACLVVRAVGVDAEMELAYAGLHQLLAPVLSHVDALPVPQQQALRTAFGLSAGPPPERFLVALAALGILAEAAAGQPVLCVVDDEQWLDRASVQALAFVARRLQAEAVGVVFASRAPGSELAGLPELLVDGLAVADARVLLDSVLTSPVDPHVRDVVLAETRGNPLALLELPRGRTPAELAGGFGLLEAVPLSGRIEESFGRQVDGLPDQTRRLMALASADPTGDPALVWRAAGELGIPVEAAAPAAEARLLEFGAWVRFRHSLVRSAVYRSASLGTRREVHAALAAATDPEADPDRRAWHLAQATLGPDEEVASELERSAARAQKRGGVAAAAAFLERAALLTPGSGLRAQRTLAAARAKRQAGALDEAQELLNAAESGMLDSRQEAEVTWLRGLIADDGLRARDAVLLLRRAAVVLDPLDAATAREIHLEALRAASRTQGQGMPGGMLGAAELALAAPPAPQPPRPVDLVLEAYAVLHLQGHVQAAPALVAALQSVLALPERTEDERSAKWYVNGRFAANLALELWDFDTWQVIATSQVELARDLGAPIILQDTLNHLAGTRLLSGDLAGAARLMEEERLISAATGNAPNAYTAAILAAWRGDDEEAMRMIRAVAQGAVAAESVERWDSVEYGEVVLNNSMGRYAEAREIALTIFGHDRTGFDANVLPEVAEAAARTGDLETLRVLVDRMSRLTRVTRTEWALGIDARVRALAGDGPEVDALFQESIERLGRTRIRTQLARSHLLYGEWLRRQGRRLDARSQLRTAHAMFEEMGMAGFAERTRRELLATGETARKRTPTAASASSEPLTPQEAEIARLARDGFSNPEIGARLFLSSRTVQYHLKKVFAKLDITSRGQLHRVLDPDEATDRTRG